MASPLNLMPLTEPTPQNRARPNSNEKIVKKRSKVRQHTPSDFVGLFFFQCFFFRSRLCFLFFLVFVFADVFIRFIVHENKIPLVSLRSGYLFSYAKIRAPIHLCVSNLRNLSNLFHPSNFSNLSCLSYLSHLSYLSTVSNLSNLSKSPCLISSV